MKNQIVKILKCVCAIIAITGALGGIVGGFIVGDGIFLISVTLIVWFVTAIQSLLLYGVAMLIDLNQNNNELLQEALRTMRDK